jgi:hypothetical protein
MLIASPASISRFPKNPLVMSVMSPYLSSVPDRLDGVRPAVSWAEVVVTEGRDGVDKTALE